MISQNSMCVKHVENHSTMYWDWQSTARHTGIALEFFIRQYYVLRNYTIYIYFF